MTSQRWSENGQVLVHENRGATKPGCLVAIAVTVLIPLIAAGWVAVAAFLMVCTLFALGTLAHVVRVEFDRQSRTMRQRNALGLTWTDRLDRFAGVEVVRATTARGQRQIRVNLTRAGVIRYYENSDYLVAVYGFPDDDAEKDAREWGDRLARFLQLPLDIKL